MWGRDKGEGRQHEWFSKYDARRTGENERHGFVVQRFTNYDVSNELESVLMRIAEASAFPANMHPHPWPLSHMGEGERP